MLSIITVTYNNLEGIKKTYNSIVNQTMQTFEWIVIDGASTDGTTEFLQTVSRQPDIYVHEPDSGIYNAMNKGIKIAKGDYLLFMNAGDIFADCNILQETPIQSFKADIIYGDAWFDYPDRTLAQQYSDKVTMGSLYKNSFCHQSTFIRRTLLVKDGYDETYKLLADWKSYVAWFLEGKSFQHLPLFICRFDVSGASTNRELCDAEHHRIFTELLPPYLHELLRDWNSYQNKPCILTRNYCAQNRVYRRIIRSTLHLLTWINKVIHC